MRWAFRHRLLYPARGMAQSLPRIRRRFPTALHRLDAKTSSLPMRQSEDRLNERDAKPLSRIAAGTAYCTAIARARSAGAACLVRSAPAHLAMAGSARGTGRPLRRLAFRDHVAADDGENGQTLFRRFPAPLAGSSRRSPPRRSKRLCSNGRGSAIIRGRAICTPARRADRRRAWRRISRAARRRCALARASAPIRRRQLPQSPSDKRHVAVDGNVERVVARLYAIDVPLASGEALGESEGRSRWYRPSGPAISPRR